MTPDLSAKILRTFLRVSPRLSLGSGLLSFARRCHELREYRDAADSYLDILALDPSDLPDKTGVKLEAVLALLLDQDHEPEVVERRWEASLSLLEGVVTRSRVESVKRKGREQSQMIVIYFLFGKIEAAESTDSRHAVTRSPLQTDGRLSQCSEELQHQPPALPGPGRA